MEEANPASFSPLSSLISLYSSVCGYFCRWFLRILAVGPIPEHIAIIMDGNRRYADRTRINRSMGHLHGYDRLIGTLENCLQLGVKYVTVYAFSIDNFQRPADEVSALMNLMEEKLDHLCNSSRLTKEFGVRVQVLGDLSLLPSNVRAAAERAMVATKQNRSVVLNICVAYTSTAEIVHSIQEIRDRFCTSLSRSVLDNAKDSTHAWSAQAESGDWNVLYKPKQDYRPAVNNDYQHSREIDALCSKSSPVHLEVRNKERTDYVLHETMSNKTPALCSESRLRSRKNGRVRDEALGSQATLENGSRKGEEPPSRMVIGHTFFSEQLPVSEVTDESENWESKKVLPLNLDFITVKEIDCHLYTAGCPPPDILIRTSGETRLSNFLLWQCAASHLAFCKVLWPEFSLRHLIWIILDYQRSIADLEKQRRLEEELLS